MENIQSDLVALLGSEVKDVKVFSRVEAAALAATIRGKFGDARRTSDALWETLNETQAYYREEADIQEKQRIQFFSCPPSLLIADRPSRYSALGFPNGDLLWSVLDRSYGFVWYITDLELSFLLCRNDHEFVIWRDQPRGTDTKSDKQ